MCSSRPPVKDFNVGVGTNPHQAGRRLEPDGLVKACFEVADWPVHKNDRRALINPDNTAEPLLDAYDIANAKPELILLRPPDQADKLELVGIGPIAFLKLRFHWSIREISHLP